MGIFWSKEEPSQVTARCSKRNETENMWQVFCNLRAPSIIRYLQGSWVWTFGQNAWRKICLKLLSFKCGQSHSKQALESFKILIITQNI